MFLASYPNQYTLHNKMANLKGVINYFVSSTMQITSAMKMVSATKLKKAKCNSHASLCRKINGIITKSFCYTEEVMQVDSSTT
jgi:hypothetical protein